MAKKTVADLPADLLRGKKVLVRVDYNVPLENGSITDDRRITATLPTLRYLTDAGARVILVSHLGRPKGKVNKDMSLKPVAQRLEELVDVRRTETQREPMITASQPDELMIITAVYDHDARKKSYSLLAEAFGLG